MRREEKRREERRRKIGDGEGREENNGELVEKS